MQIDSLGRSGKFDELREFLRSAGYTEEFLCARFHLERAEQFELDRGKRAPLPEPASAADILTALYLAGEFASLEQAERLMGRDGVGLLSGMGLLAIDAGRRPVPRNRGALPAGGSAISLRTAGATPATPPSRLPATRSTRRSSPTRACFWSMSRWANAAVSWICARARESPRSWRQDRAPARLGRATSPNDAPALPNSMAGLNGVANFHPVTSDLYGSLGSFDRIVAHPPYVPALQPKWIFFSGGEDGEEITRRIVEGLPAHLNDRGVFLALTMGTDRSDAPFESAHPGMARGGRRGLRHRADRQKDHRTPRVRRAEPRGIRGLEEAVCAAGRGIAGLRLRHNPAEKRRSPDVHRAAAGKPRPPPRAVGVAACLGGRGQGRSDPRETASPRPRRRVSSAAPARRQRLDAATVHAANRVAVQHGMRRSPLDGQPDRAVRWARHGTRPASRVGGERSTAAGYCGRGVRARGGRPGFRRVHRSGRVQAASGSRIISSNCGAGKSPGT